MGPLPCRACRGVGITTLVEEFKLVIGEGAVIRKLILVCVDFTVGPAQSMHPQIEGNYQINRP